jgi:putative membrane protein
MKQAYVAGRRARRPQGLALAAPRVLAALAILGQIAYPLLSGDALRAVTIGTVVAFFLASVTHAVAHHGWWWATGLVVVTAGGGLGAEVLGLRTGFPFGTYSYAGTLGPQVLGVPVVVCLAWTMMAYPAFVIARKLVGAVTLAVPVVGGVALAAWDLFLDPQMVAAGHWTWADPTPALPGVPGVPLSNYAGWLLVSVVLMTVLTLLMPDDHAAIGVPLLLYVWTWAGSVVANVVFFDRPAVAVAGGIGMGLVAVPALWWAWNSRP